MQEVAFEQARDLFDFLVFDPRFEPTHLFATLERGRSGSIFRGQANADWSLLPLVHRGLGASDPHPLTPFVSQLPDTSFLAARRGHYLAHQVFAELKAVHLFLEAADRVGLPSPLDYRHLRVDLEVVTAAMRHDLLVRGLEVTSAPALSRDEAEHALAEAAKNPFPSGETHQALAFAQHNGIPTRLLDWCESPLVAAYFAAVELSAVTPASQRPDADRMAGLLAAPAAT